MSLAHGRSYLAIPGPSVVPDEVLREMHRASPNIYEGEVVEMMPALIDGLKQVARTQHHAAIYMGNGHAAWEASLANVIEPGDLVLVPVTGHFCREWGDMARALGAEVEEIDFGLQAPMDAEVIEARLRADTEQRIKAVLAVHVDTSTSIKNDIAAVRGALDRAGHTALLMADCIASMGCDRFEMDAWGVDVAVTASQKGLMMPPGLGFVFFNDRAMMRRQQLARVSMYWDWSLRAEPEIFFRYFCGTAPTAHLFGLRSALNMIHSEGMTAVWDRHAALSRAIWAACDAWGQGGPLRMNVAERAHRSHAVTALSLGAPHGTRLRQWCTRQAGLTLGIGLGMRSDTDPQGDGFLRFGHMGHVNAHMVLGFLSTVQAGLQAVNVPFGSGALDAAAAVIAETD